MSSFFSKYAKFDGTFNNREKNWGNLLGFGIIACDITLADSK